MDIEQNENKVDKIIDRRGGDALERQQLITYFIAMGLVVVGMTMHLVGILGSNLPILRLFSLADLLICVSMFILWMLHKVTVKRAFGITSIIFQLIQSAKIMIIAIGLWNVFNHLIIMNGIISMMLMAILAISYMRKLTIFVGVANILTLVTSGIIINNGIQWQYIILIILFTVFFMLMAELMYKNVKKLKDDNLNYQANEHNFLETVRLNRREIRAYLAMCRTGNLSDDDTDRLFGMLSEKSQHNVINAVERKKAIDESREEVVKKAFPDFTPMEIEVSRLVLQGLKLSQIINITGKSESNISVVRSRIRKKLGLAAGDDLHDALLRKMEGEV